MNDTQDPLEPRPRAGLPPSPVRAELMGKRNTDYQVALQLPISISSGEIKHKILPAICDTDEFILAGYYTLIYGGKISHPLLLYWKTIAC